MLTNEERNAIQARYDKHFKAHQTDSIIPDDLYADYYKDIHALQTALDEAEKILKRRTEQRDALSKIINSIHTYNREEDIEELTDDRDFWKMRAQEGTCEHCKYDDRDLWKKKAEAMERALSNHCFACVNAKPPRIETLSGFPNMISCEHLPKVLATNGIRKGCGHWVFDEARFMEDENENFLCNNT